MWEFKRLRPVAVWVGGSRATFSGTVRHPNGTETHYGKGNKPCRAVCLGMSTYFTDEVSKRLHQVPYFRQQLLCRVWVKDSDDAKTLMTGMVRRLADAGEPTMLEKDFIDVGADYDLNWLGSDFIKCAADDMVEIWDDHALVARLLASAEQRTRDESSSVVRSPSRVASALVRRQ